jgi:glucose/arabinose dehydrogenase
LTILSLAGCSAEPATTPTAAAPRSPIAEAVVVADGFIQPVLTVIRPGDDRLYVVDQPGQVWALRGGERALVLDMGGMVKQGRAGGLVGLTFHPDTPERMFVFYATVAEAVALDEYRFPLDAEAPDPSRVRRIITFDRPVQFLEDPIAALTAHNGGMVAFGPDGYLYLGPGDGGGADDPFAQAQDTTTLWGSILRLDVDGEPPYQIPPDNPFADGGEGLPEIWAWGLRNPFRFTFDGTDLWIGDVGQNRREEVDRISTLQPGANFGWPILEGERCSQGTAAECADPSLVAPIFDYRHARGCAVVGGYVYRGSAIEELAGTYVFGDFCTGEIMRLTTGSAGEVRARRIGPVLPELTSFGLDENGELYVTAGTAVYRLLPAD